MSRDNPHQHPEKRISSINFSGVGDDKSAIEYHTAYQSMADINEIQNKQQTSNDKQYSWQAHHNNSTINENSQKSFHDIVNKGSSGLIFTEQTINDQRM